MVIPVTVEALAEVDRQEEIIGATEMTDRAELAIEIAIEVTMIVISIEREEVAEVVVVAAVVYVMHTRKVTAQEAHHADLNMKREEKPVVVVVVVGCAMTIKVADVTEVILVDFHMKKVVVIEIDEAVMVDVEMKEGEAEGEMVVGIVTKERPDRSVVMMQ